jgi:LCP family protein required for cell wall assembly
LRPANEKKPVENFISKLHLEEWYNRFFSRPAARNTWSGVPMARPMVRNSAVRYPNARPGSRFGRPTSRTQRDAIVVLGIAFALIFCAFIITCLVLIFQSSDQPAQAAAPAAAPKTSPAGLFSGPMPAGQTKILLLGSDQRPNDNGYRTDVMMLVTIDTGPKTVSVVSFPRDLWVKVPALYEMKINQVQALGGFEATAGMFQANFGVKPDYYVLTNFNGFIQFFDDQGGVDVQVGQELTDECSLPQRVNSMCTVEPGTVHMNGATALWYVRSRHSSSDFDRLRRAQEVVYAIFKKLINNISLSKLSEIKAGLQNNIETNLPIEKAISFLPVAAHVLEAPQEIKTFAIDEKQSTPSWSWNGLWILLPDTEAIKGVLRDAGIKP